MNKVTLLICLAICCAASPHTTAQTSPVSFGLKGGVNFSTVGGEDAELKASNFLPLDQLGQFGSFDITAEPQSKTLFTGGVYATYTFNPILAVQAEVLYAGKGVRYDRDFSYSFGFFGSMSGNMKADAELTYVEIPLLFKVSAPIEGSVKPYVFAGPNFGVLLDKKTSVEGRATLVFGGETTEIPTTPIPAKFTFNDLDIGATFGGGLNIRMMNTAIGAEVRYTMGFQSAVETVSVEDSPLGEGQAATELDMKNRTLGITAFMEFYF